MTWRLRAQAHISPGGLRVRLSSLPAGAWSTRHTLPRTMCANAEQQWSKQVCHSPPPPSLHKHTRAHTHRHGGISRPRAPPRGLGAVSSPVGLVTGHPGTAARSGPAGKAARTVGRRPGEAFTQPNPTQPNPTPPPPVCSPALEVGLWTSPPGPRVRTAWFTDRQ